MTTVSVRLLQVLSLLQAHPTWTGQQLAERLGVSARTVRSDIDKLREIGYPVHAVSGVAGGYRLAPGVKLPPLLLDDDEATAVALGLSSAAGGSFAGIEDAAVRALAKLDKVLPARLSRRIDLIRQATVTRRDDGPPVDPDVLTTIAAACRDHDRLRVDYRTHDGIAQRRELEPHRLVHLGRKWYLIGWDTDQQDWRTFRVDRLRPRVPTGPRFTPREPPERDLTTYVTRGVDAALARYRATVTVHKSATDLTGWLTPSTVIEAVDEHTCIAHVGAETPHMLAANIVVIDAEFAVDGPPELLDALDVLAGRCRAVRRAESTPR